MLDAYDKSILVVTEGFGSQRFHGRAVILVNEHTSSAGEMVAAFAAENRLATIIGAKAPGRLLSGRTFRVPRISPGKEQSSRAKA
jgi:carboxyl-terminal processing protease